MRRKARLRKELTMQRRVDALEIPDRDVENDILFFDTFGNEVVHDKFVNAMLAYLGRNEKGFG
jgi:hypothetical protein